MKSHSHLRRPSRPAALHSVVLGLAGVALLGLALPWSAPAHASEPNGAGTAPLVASNEAIGTLPCYWVDDGVWPVLNQLGATAKTMFSHAAVTAYVDECHIDELVHAANGFGFVLLDHIGSEGLVRMRFYGEVRLTLNRTLLMSGGAQLATTIGSHFNGGEGVLWWASAKSSVFTLPAAGSALPLSMPSLLASGSLKGSGLTFWLKSKWNNVGRVVVIDKNSQVLVAQEMPI